MEVIADARRGNINQLENVFPSLTHPLVCFGPAAFLASARFPRFPWKTGTFSRLVFCPLSLPPSLPPVAHLFICTQVIWIPELLCVSGDWWGMLPHGCSGKIPDVRKLISPTRLGHVVGQEVLHQAPLNSLGDCSSQPNGNKARGAGERGRSPLHLHPRPLRARRRHVL